MCLHDSHFTCHCMQGSTFVSVCTACLQETRSNTRYDLFLIGVTQANASNIYPLWVNEPSANIHLHLPIMSEWEAQDLSTLIDCLNGCWTRVLTSTHYDWKSQPGFEYPYKLFEWSLNKGFRWGFKHFLDLLARKLSLDKCKC